MNTKKILILLFLPLFVLTWCNSTTDESNEDTTAIIEDNNSFQITDESDEVENQELDYENELSDAEFTAKYPDWSEESHSKKADLDYDEVFPQDSVNRIDIVISEDNWESMMGNMEDLYWEFWKWNAKINDSSTSDEKPSYIETQVYFNDIQWYNVWMKFKWHSSLKSAWSSWDLKLPFKLNFDKYEDEELENQRFYWFKKLSFSSNYNDDWFINEKLATETFEKAWLTDSKTAFYTVYVDYWDGPEYFWLYTAVEVIDDTVIEKFWDDSWNLYEAEWDWATLSSGTYDEINTSFEKKTNEEYSDWSDIENLSNILNSDTRTTDLIAWEESLEEVFDVDVFLKWLAVNSTIQNWDTYWIMNHNYYLYNNPENGKLTWIPWDNNESFGEWKKWIVTLTWNSISDDWPLIRYLLDDENYRSKYVDYVHEFTTNVLDTDEYTNRITELHNLVAPYVIWDDWETEWFWTLKNENSFISSLSTFLSFIEWRIEAASSLSLHDDWTYDSNSNTLFGWQWMWGEQWWNLWIWWPGWMWAPGWNNWWRPPMQ